jgi:hypothetical protein
MIERLPTTYQDDTKSISCFTSSGAFTIDPDERHAIMEDPDTWHLVDSSMEFIGIPEQYSNKIVILTTSLPMKRYEKHLKEHAALKIWMEPFSWSEIWLTA